MCVERSPLPFPLKNRRPPFLLAFPSFLTPQISLAQHIPTRHVVQVPGFPNPPCHPAQNRPGSLFERDLYQPCEPMSSKKLSRFHHGLVWTGAGASDEG